MGNTRIQDLPAGTPAATARIPFVDAAGNATYYTTPPLAALNAFGSGSNGDSVTYSGGTPTFVNHDFSLSVNFGDLKQTSAYTGGTVFSQRVPYDCVVENIEAKGSTVAGTITGTGGTATFDVYKATYATFSAMGTAQSIFGTATKPNLTGTATYQNTSLAGYTTTFTKGDWLTFVTTNAGFVWSCLTISGRRTATS